jgi:hypothetical protein
MDRETGEVTESDDTSTNVERNIKRTRLTIHPSLLDSMFLQRKLHLVSQLFLSFLLVRISYKVGR